MELTATDKNGVTQLENVVNDLSPAGATRSDYGMEHAKDIINASKAADTDDQRGRVVIMFTDGNPTDHRNFNVTVANGAISAAKDIKDVGAKVYTIGVFGEDPDDRINKYMNRVSSNCPNAFDMSEGGAGADADENAGYYSTAANADDLSRIFSSISSNISEATNKALDGKTEVNDVVSDYFDLAANDVNSIKVYTADRTADGGWADKQLVTDPSVTVALSGKTIKVSGYNYAANYITDEAKSDGTYGQKLIIEIKVKPSGKGYSDKEIPTNADTAGTHAAKVEVKSEDGTETTFVTSHETAKVTGHKVIYDLDGGTGNITGDRLYYPQGADVPVTNSEPTREGFKFTGWTPSTDNINVTAPTITEGKFTMPAANVTLTAQWETKTDLSYTVNYLEKGTNAVLHEQKVQTGVTFGAEVTSTNEKINIDGYNYDSADKDTLTIGTGDNVINIYYTKRNDLSYTVNYLEKGTNAVLHEQKVQTGVTFGAEVTSTNEKINIDGYNYDSADKDSLIIGTGENVITIYYTKRNDLSYKVNYLEKTTNNVLHAQKTQNGMTFEDVITSANEVIDIDGYNYDSVDKNSLTIGTGENVINIYYTKRGDLSYTVHYYLKGTTQKVANDKTVGSQTLNTVVTEKAIQISGYRVDGSSEKSITIVTGTNEIIFYYTRIRHPSTPTKPTVEIEDDDALGLNTTDHFAYIVGYGNGEVRPQNNITRAEVATIFFRLLTDDVRDENLTKTNRYSDVAATSWYNTAVSTLSSMGIITGYPDGTFRPNAAITRAEFAAIAARFDHDGDKTAAKFSDIATHWAKDEISIAYNNGWITGYPNGTFGPQRDITRAETMTLVNRVLNRQPETEDDLLPNMTVWTDNANPKAWYYLAVQEATNSHYYEFKTNSQYEKWTELRETRDWTQLEK